MSDPQLPTPEQGNNASDPYAVPAPEAATPAPYDAASAQQQAYAQGTDQGYQTYQQAGYQQAYSQGHGQPPYQQTYPVPAGYAQKSRLAAGLLGIFLGGLGVHNFYLGHTVKAVIQLLISVLSLGMLAWVSGIWGLIEGILYLTGEGKPGWGFDARGVPLN